MLFAGRAGPWRLIWRELLNDAAASGPPQISNYLL
jgi:hypothetical protein